MHSMHIDINWWNLKERKEKKRLYSSKCKNFYVFFFFRKGRFVALWVYRAWTRLGVGQNNATSRAARNCTRSTSSSSYPHKDRPLLRHGFASRDEYFPAAVSASSLSDFAIDGPPESQCHGATSTPTPTTAIVSDQERKCLEEHQYKWRHNVDEAGGLPSGHRPAVANVSPRHGEGFAESPRTTNTGENVDERVHRGSALF